MSLAELMDNQNKQEETKRILSPLEIAGMFHVSESNLRDCMLLKCIYFLGLSNSEVQSLKAEDIDFENGKVRVIKGQRKKARYISIPEGFDMELKNFINGNGYVFSGRSMGLLSDRHIRRIVKSYACKANVRKCEEIHPHSLKDSSTMHLNSFKKER